MTESDTTIPSLCDQGGEATSHGAVVKPQFDVISYGDDGQSEAISLRLDTKTQTIWATQAQMAALFETTQQNASKHIGGIFEEGELDEGNNTTKICILGSKKPSTLYSLDVVISVGYRVNSKAATRFRQWATKILKAYVEQGYVIDQEALQRSPEKLDQLAAEIRALRSSEKVHYEKVRECFKLGASDYNSRSEDSRRFYALVQDKFHYAVTMMTSAEVILDRADHCSEHMGLRNFKGSQPTQSEVVIGKNYLDKAELDRLHMLSEQFLLFAESAALRGKKMTMASLRQKLDDLLRVNEYPVFDGYHVPQRKEADRHARSEFKRYQDRLSVEAAGLEYEPEACAYGDYDHILRPDA